MTAENSADKLWKLISSTLQTRIFDGQYQMCFGESTAISLVENTLTVALKNTTAREWAVHRLNNIIDETLKQLDLSSLKLNFVVETATQLSLSDVQPLETELPETIVVRDRRKPRQYSIENIIMDEWYPIIRQSGYLIYSFYVRMANRDKDESAWPAYSLLREHLKIGSSTISEYNQLLVGCRLLHIQPGNARRSNVYYILDPQPVSPELLSDLYQTVKRDWPQKSKLRETVLQRIEDWVPLQALWEQRRHNGKNAIRVIRAASGSPHTNNTENLTEILEQLGVWHSEIPKLLQQYPSDAIRRAVEQTQNKPGVQRPGAYLRVLLKKQYPA